MKYPLKTSMLLAALCGAALFPTIAGAAMQDSGDLVGEVRQQHSRQPGVDTTGGMMLGAPIGAREEEENVWQGINEEPDELQSGRSATPVEPREYEPGAPLSPRDQERNLRELPY